MKQEKILLKSKDVQPFLNQDEYIDFEITSSSKEIRVGYLSNDFDIEQEYDKERNNSRKFFIYGRLYGKQIDTNDLTITFSTTNNDTLYVPNKKNNILAPGAKTFSVKTKSLTKNTSLSKNIFGKIESGYFFQFEIDNVESKITNNLKTIVTDIDVDNETLTPIVLYDSDGNFVPYGTIDTVFDKDFNLVDVNNDFVFLYDYHWIKQNFDVVTFNNVFFPYKKFQDTEGNTIIENSTQITDADLNPTFRLLMDYQSFYGLEKATLNVKKVLKPRDGYVFPLSLFNQEELDFFSPWKGFPSTSNEWGSLAWVIRTYRDYILNNQNAYSNLNVFDTGQQFYEANVRYFLSFLKGSGIDSRRNDVLTSEIVRDGFLNYSQSIYKKDVDSTITGEFVSGFTRDIGKIIDTVEVEFKKGTNVQEYNINLSGITFYNKLDYLEIGFDKLENVYAGTPSTYFVNVISENKKPTAYFKENYISTEALDQEFELIVELDKTYQESTPVVLSISASSIGTTAINLQEAIANNPLTSNEPPKYDYEIITKSITINKGDKTAIFKIKINYSNQYFFTKTINLELTSSSKNILVDEFDNTTAIDIISSNIPGWTKYQIVGDDLTGFGILRSNRLISNTNAIYNFEIESPKDTPSVRYNFTPNFSYTIACINRGDTDIPYEGDYGGEQKLVKPGETMFEIQSEMQFESFNFVLPSNTELIEDTDIEKNKRGKYLKSKYEFVIKNIEPVSSTDSSKTSVFTNVVIPAVSLFAFVKTTKKTVNEWKFVINGIDFFENSVNTSSLPQNIKDELGSKKINVGIDNVFAESIKCVFVLRTGVENLYYPKPIDSESKINQNINHATQGTTLAATSMFGTLILNQTVDSLSATKIKYIKFSNNKDLKKLLVPSLVSINTIQTQEDAAGFKKYFYFTFKFSGAAGLKYTSDPNVIALPFNFSKIKEIPFENAEQVLGVQSYSDSAAGIKPLPVFAPVSENELVIN